MTAEEEPFIKKLAEDFGREPSEQEIQVTASIDT